VRNEKRFAIVITHTGARKDLLEMDWLGRDYQVDESDWIVLSKQGWQALATGEAPVWQTLHRRLLIGTYISQPELIAVIGHPLGGRRDGPAEQDRERQDVGRIVDRVRSLRLSPAVMGFWADEDGWLIDIVEADPAADEVPTTSVAVKEGEPAV
jgi:hypothetical protein